MSEEDGPYGTHAAERPAYKEHPLWIEAMALTHAAYELADKIRPDDPKMARQLRRAAVAIPAHVAGALTTDEDSRRDHVLTARGALAEVARQAERAGPGQPTAAEGLTRRAGELERSVCFQLGDAGTLVC
jgi:four helix bundle protein